MPKSVGRPSKLAAEQKAAFGGRLYEARIKRNISQEQLANTLGTVRTSVVNYENGRGFPSLEKFIVICLALEVSADTLLGLKKARK